MQDAFPARALLGPGMAEPSYTPPDPTVIEDKPEALRYWSRTLEFDEERIRKAVRKVGPLVEHVKHELGSYGAG
jgi:hypothetical protein